MPTRRHFLTRCLPALALTPALAHAQPSADWTVNLKAATLPIATGHRVFLHIHYRVTTNYPLASYISTHKGLSITAAQFRFNVSGGATPALLFRATYSPVGGPRDQIDSVSIASPLLRTLSESANGKVIFSYRARLSLASTPYTLDLELAPHEPVA